MREILMIVTVATCTIGSQVLLKHGISRLQIRDPGMDFLGWLWGVATSPSVIAAVALQGFGFLLWIVVITRVKLGVAFAISGATFYLLMAAVGWLVYGERLGLTQWGGLVLISCGVVLMVTAGRG